MTDQNIELTRRKILGGVGAVGIAGAGAGVGTSALLSDEESFADNSIIAAATLDLKVTAEIVEASPYYTGAGDGPDIIGETKVADGDPVIGLQTSDVKPGDWVVVGFEIDSTDSTSPGYVRVSTDGFAQYENGQTEPEIAAEGDDGTDAGDLGTPLNGAGEGELQDELLAEVYGTYDPDSGGDPPRSYLDDPEPSLSGSARAVFEQFATGYVIGGPADPLVIGSGVDTVKRYLLLELPTDVGNEVQSDAIEFDVVFDAVQASNNDGFVPSSSLVGYWPLNDVENGPVEDLSGNGNHGTVQGDVSAVSGQVAGAGSFDGTGDFVQIDDDSSLGVTSVTVSAWVYRDGSKNNVYVVDGRDHNYALKFDDGTSTPQFYIFSNGSVAKLRANSGDIPNQTWTHVAATYDGSELNIYVNGTNEGTKTASGAIDVSSGPSRIGDYIGGGYEFRGWIDDVRIYDRALSDTEVTKLYDDAK